MKKPEQLKEPIPLGYGLADARIDECRDYVRDQFKKGHSIKMTIIDHEIDPYNFKKKYGDSCIVSNAIEYNASKEFHSLVIFTPLSSDKLKEFKGLFQEDIFRFYNFD